MIKGMYSNLPHYVYLKNERFIINTDFRIFITFEEEMTQGIDKKKACTTALRNFYGSAFSLIIQKNLLKEATDKFIWFYHCGKKDNPNKKGKKGKSKEAFRYSYDDLYIWGTYKQLGYNLSKDYIHWWEFRAIWLTIPSEFEFSKIKGYRVYNGKDKDILELQEYYQLPPNEKEIQDRIRQDKIYESLK